MSRFFLAASGIVLLVVLILSLLTGPWPVFPFFPVGISMVLVPVMGVILGVLAVTAFLMTRIDLPDDVPTEADESIGLTLIEPIRFSFAAAAGIGSYYLVLAVPFLHFLQQATQIVMLVSVIMSVYLTSRMILILTRYFTMLVLDLPQRVLREDIQEALNNIIPRGDVHE